MIIPIKNKRILAMQNIDAKDFQRFLFFTTIRSRIDQEAKTIHFLPSSFCRTHVDVLFPQT